MPSPNDCQTLQAWFEEVEQARLEANAKWGFERLPMLVPPDLRAKFRANLERWSKAYQAAWDAPMLTRDLLDEVKARAGSMQRGWAALDAAAEEAGHRPIAPYVWEVPLADGAVAAFVQTQAEVGKVIASGRYVAVYTPEEIGNLINAIPEFFKLAKVEFPGARFVGASSDTGWVKHGDELPDFTKGIAA